MAKNARAGGGGGVPTPDAPHSTPGPLAADSVEWLRVTLSCIGDGVITTDPQGRVTFLNPVAEALTGWTQEQASDAGGVAIERVFNIISEATRAAVESPTVRALREGVVVGLANHTILIARDGTEVPIDDSAAAIRNARGETAGAVLVFHDVTEHKRQQKLVSDAREFAENILETQRGPFLVLDQSLRVVSANRSFYTTFRVEAEATVGRFVYDLGDGQWNIPRLRELLEEVLPRDHAFEGFEVAHDFPAGVGQKTMLLNVRKVLRPGNNSELILLAIEDITERKQAQLAQRDSELRFRRLFESAQDGILILDARSGKITDANAFMCGLTGLEAAELVGKELYEIGMYKDIEENKAAFQELQRTRYLRHDHLPVRNQRGGEAEVEFVANIYEEGDTLVAQCNVRNISDRVRLEKEIATQTEALIAQARAKDEFLAMLSHELRNPLAPIRAAAHLLRLEEGAAAGGGNPIQQQAREIIERQVANLTQMVSDLSEVSRVISGTIRMDLEPVELRQAIAHALQAVSPLVEQHRHSVSVTPCFEPVWVQADPTRLEEVLVNLLNNAAKYTPDGGRIGVSCEHHREGGRTHAIVRVRDNGVGIEESLLPRIFDLFTQADRSLARSSGGLGIGLSLAQRLVALHGGTIWAHSHGPGMGSEFTIELPMIPAPVADPASEAQTPIDEARRPEGARSGRAEGAGLRVLVVDDNVDLVTMLCGALRHKGFIVRSAYTGPEGLRIAQEWRPEIALLDIGLPGLDGYEIARRLRSDHLFRVEAAGKGGVGDGEVGVRMKLIAITGYGREDDIALAREAGFDGHMVKPCDMEKLEEMMAAPSLGR